MRFTSQNLCLGFKEPLIQKVHFDFPQGVHLISGPNGSGKTCFFETLTGHTVSLGGDVLLDGRSLGEMQPSRRSCFVTFFPHSPTFGNYPTVREYLCSAKAFMLIDTAALQAQIAKWDIQSFLDLPPHQLSMGQQKRCHLARFLLNRSPVKLLDEPLTNLDLKYAAVLLEDLRQRTNEIILLSHHSIHLDLDAFDSFSFLNDGSFKTAQKGDHDTILRLAESTYGVTFRKTDRWLIPERYC